MSGGSPLKIGVIVTACRLATATYVSNLCDGASTHGAPGCAAALLSERPPFDCRAAAHEACAFFAAKEHQSHPASCRVVNDHSGGGRGDSPFMWGLLLSILADVIISVGLTLQKAAHEVAKQAHADDGDAPAAQRLSTASSTGAHGDTTPMLRKSADSSGVGADDEWAITSTPRSSSADDEATLVNIADEEAVHPTPATTPTRGLAGASGSADVLGTIAEEPAPSLLAEEPVVPSSFPQTPPPPSPPTAPFPQAPPNDAAEEPAPLSHSSTPASPSSPVALFSQVPPDDIAEEPAPPSLPPTPPPPSSPMALFPQMPLNDGPKPPAWAAGASSRLWWVGICVTLAGEIGNFAAYGDPNTPSSVVAAVGCVGLLANTLLAVCLLGEPLRRRDLIGSCFLIIGVVVMCVYTPAQPCLLTPERLYWLLEQPGNIVFVVVLAISIVVAAALSAKRGHRHPLYHVLLASLLGAITVLSSKALASFIGLVFTGSMDFLEPAFVAAALLLAGSGYGQVRALNEAMRIFPQQRTIPVHYVTFTLITIVSAAIFYRELNVEEPMNVRLFIDGTLLTWLGIWACTSDGTFFTSVSKILLSEKVIMQRPSQYARFL